LGVAVTEDEQRMPADRYLTEALTRYRRINLVDHEADILLDLARLRAAQHVRAEALRLADEALTITERGEHVLQGADVHLVLARLALEAGDRATALDHARQARHLAACDGPPDYTYKVAYEEAGELLKELTKDEGLRTNPSREGVLRPSSFVLRPLKRFCHLAQPHRMVRI
jgi:tetratricopeptide (TPR) repeat protein